MSVSGPMPVDVPTGWECPRCHRVYSPQTGQCVPCSPPSALFAGPLPRPEPRRFPHPIGGLAVPLEPIPAEPVPGAENASRRHWEYPVGGPGCPGCAAADDEAGRCPECRMPLTMHHDPGCSRPCGKCEAAKGGGSPGEYVYGSLAPGPLIRLPPHMDTPGFCWRALIGGKWRELFPGFQARRRSVSHDDTLGAVADIEFRLTPPPESDGPAA